MSDILILSSDPTHYFELEKAGVDEGFRVKTVQEIENAIEWLKLRSFDALLIDSRLSISAQQKLADLLWNTNPVAHLISYSFQSRNRADSTQARLFGADVVTGPDTINGIREILRSIAKPAKLASRDFNILVVEDLDSPRDIICTYLESLGFNHVTGVESAKEALELLDNGAIPFSCVITDIRMPRMTGAELIAEIRSRERFASLPIIVLTAYGTVDCLVDCLKNGASGFLVKPPKRPDLQRELGRAMRINASGKDARLSTPEDAEFVQEMLEKRGFGA